MSNYYIALDTETGSVYPEKGDLLTAYFAVLDEEFNILEELDLKLKPNNGRLPIAEYGALKINGINIKDHMNDSKTIYYSLGKDRLLTLLNKYLKKNRGKSNLQVFGYNVIGFDIGFLQHYLLPKENWDNIFHYKSVDIMQHIDFLKFHGWLPKEIGNLNSVVDHFGIQKLNAHEAKSDVLMTIEVHKKLIELMDSKKNGGQQQDLIALLEAE